MENNNVFYEQWLNDLQVTVDSLREQRDEDRQRIAELQQQVAMYRSMVDRLKQLINKGEYL